MDQQRFAALVEKVLARFASESAVGTVLPRAYVMFPIGWKAQNHTQCAEALRKLREGYHTIAVLPDEGNDPEDHTGIGASAVITRNGAVFPSDDFITVFPVADRNLVVKTALCLQDDFESRWVARCIANGRPVYMCREAPMFTGKEPYAYRRKILSYYHDAEGFGVKFAGIVQKKKIITAGDVEKLDVENVLKLAPGDILTALAAERAEERGIRLRYEIKEGMLNGESFGVD